MHIKTPFKNGIVIKDVVVFRFSRKNYIYMYVCNFFFPL